ncbi:MAG: ABC transporter ATP-binding protein [Candidatus Babeliaceae bacterium]|nr:ABC transporter ATP-binding protein [Candidatus Babeliaceae bacterium]
MGIFKRLAEKPADKVRLIPIDFQKPWWHIFWAQRWITGCLLVSLTIFDILNTLFPLLIGQAISAQSITYLAVIISVYLAQEASSWLIARPFITILQAQVVDSFRYNAYRSLLGIDPAYHAQHSSGVSIGKIRRTSEAYLRLTKKMLDDLIPILIINITTLISVFYYSTTIGFIVTGIVITVGTFLGFIIIRSTKKIELQANRDDDMANHIGNESLSRNAYIRATFASDEVLHKLTDSHKRVMRSSATFHMTYRLLRGISVFCYLIVIAVIAAIMILFVRSGSLSSIMALSLMVMIFRSTEPLIKLDKYIVDAVSSYRKITDFYRYIRAYGKQTYPVFADQVSEEIGSQTCTTDPISIAIEHVSLSYPEGEHIFSDLTLHTSVRRDQENKLYGIIGPSGIGKTTFISLLGGQLKPTTGHVLVNGCDIYTINDQQRQKLIALQGQIASGIHGTLRANLLFGLPQHHTYTDEDFIDLLESVGIWYIFSDKGGLNTLIGEGGMTISGGQRQRLNFANLYLRAKAYRPSLILIDEPTSSLDEVSEHRITQMITELAQKSMTLVIAHRLRTLENAHRILDFCLLHENNEFVFQTTQELIKLSPYYRQLIGGETGLEDGEEE